MFYGLINSSFWDTFVGVHNSFGVKHFLDLLVNVENFVGFLQVEILNFVSNSMFSTDTSFVLGHPFKDFSIVDCFIVFGANIDVKVSISNVSIAQDFNVRKTPSEVFK